jgi:hypothetical protein
MEVEMTITSRRAVLAGAAAMPALSLPAVAGEPDTALLHLGRQLAHAIKQKAPADKAWWDEHRDLHARIEARVGRIDDHPEWDEADVERWRTVCHEEMRHSPAKEKIAEAQMAGATAVETICKQILEMPRPATLGGLGVLALATAAMNEDDVDEQFTARLVEEVLRLAGIAFPFDDEAVRS